ncbi:MAG: hypothetical protein H6Q13_3552, partial [Bacteroidetes bacterium]|nr:hypothetical protein [Bacteroidota bacterium]
LYSMVLLAFLFKKKDKNVNILKLEELTPFFFLLFFLLLLIPFQWQMETSIQFNYWRMEFMSTCILPFLIIKVSKYDEDLLNYIKYGLILAVLVSCLYAVFLLFMPSGYNPYLMTIAKLFGREYNEWYSADDGRTISRIFSTFNHPLSWCLFLGFMIFIFFKLRNEISNFLFYFILLLLFVDILYCGVRSGIVSLLPPILYLIVRNRQFKYLFYVSIVIFILFMFAANNTDLKDYLYSIIDLSGKHTSTKGSDLDMRLYQLEGCMDAIRGHEILGNGYRWTTYYMSMFGGHPKAYAFESLIFVILCNSGYLGFIIWGMFGILLFRNNRKYLNNKEDIYWMDAMCLFYFVITIVTGEYNALKVFSLYYVFLLLHLKRNFSMRSSVPRSTN